MSAITTLQDLFVQELRDTYDGEKQITKALPKMAKKAENEQLASAFTEHLEQTKGHVERLEQIFTQLDMKARGKHCAGLAGIIEEGAEVMEEVEEPVLDAALVAAAQRVEHYEIAAYGTLIAYARQLGHEEAADLLEETLNEEKDTDRRLTELAEGALNQAAQQNVASEDDEEEEAQEEEKPAGRRTMTAGASGGRGASNVKGAGKAHDLAPRPRRS
jgi:ferritin-like metal-binding protein YciE